MENIVGDLVSLETAVVVLIAFGLDAVPGIKPRWEKKNAAQKQVWIIVIMFLVSAAWAGVECYRGACPADWVEWLIVTLDAFIVNYIIANTTHFGTRHLTKAQT